MLRRPLSSIPLYMPSSILLVGLTVFPFLWLLIIAFHSVNARNLHSTWTFSGLSNFSDVITDVSLWKAAMRTVELSVLSVSAEVVLGVMFAVVLQSVFRSPRVVATVLCLPVFTSTIVVGLTWKYLFSLDNGVINSLLFRCGVPAVPWLTVTSVLPEQAPPWMTTVGEWLNLNYAFLSLLVIEVWQWTPLVTLVVLARLAGLPPRLRECAGLDGLSRRQTLSWVILPQLKRVIVIVAVLRTIDSFRVFETVWALYGDLENTATLSVRVFREALLVRDYGDAAAMGILLFFLSILTCALVLLYAARPASPNAWTRRSRV